MRFASTHRRFALFCFNKARLCKLAAYALCHAPRYRDVSSDRYRSDEFSQGSSQRQEPIYSVTYYRYLGPGT